MRLMRVLFCVATDEVNCRVEWEKRGTEMVWKDELNCMRTSLKEMVLKGSILL